MGKGTDGGDYSASERERLAQFLEEMVAGLGRAERRHWGAVYVRGLLRTSERKTAARIANTLLMRPASDRRGRRQLVM